MWPERLVKLLNLYNIIVQITYSVVLVKQKVGNYGNRWWLQTTVSNTNLVHGSYLPYIYQSHFAVNVF